MVSGVKELVADWKYDVVSIGYPGRVVGDRAVTEPRNLAHGWVGFDFAKAFGRPVKVINDAAMQALGSCKGGTMLFLGLGTGLGSSEAPPRPKRDEKRMSIPAIVNPLHGRRRCL